jgi:hypothetical protein
MTDTDVTTVRLPHTGLHVPDRSLTITGYKEHETQDGVAFAARLRHNNKIVGRVVNHGTGGMTFFYADRPAVFGETHLEAYAAQCHNEGGGAVTAEWLLDELVEETSWARIVAKEADNKMMALRLLNATTTGIRPWATRSGVSAIPADDRQWTAIGKAIAAKPSMRPGRGQWWQGWNGQFWRDLTARPKSVDVNTCH